MPKDFVEVKILDVVSLVTSIGRMPAILLEDKEERILPVIVGEEVALSLKSAIEGTKMEEEDIWTIAYSIIKESNGKVKEAIIHGVKGNRFLSYMTIGLMNKKMKIDCKPSDAISLAVRAKSPIKVAKEIMDELSFDKHQLKL